MGLQHTFVMFGATVLVPIITGLDVGIALLASGIGTLIFHILTKFKVPVYLGSSFAFIPGILAVAKAQSLPYALGGIFVAGILYVIVSILLRFISQDTLHKVLPPHVTGPMIVLIGLILAPVAIENASGVHAANLVSKIGTNGCWLLAVFTFSITVLVKVTFKKIGLKFLSMLPVLIAMVSGYLISAIFGLIDFATVKEAAWFGLPNFMMPKFSVKAISIILPIALVTIVEHFGDILAIGNVCEKEFIDDPGVHRTLMGDGIATSISALLGGPANTTYSENTGAIALTGNSNPLIMRIAACFAIVLAFVPKFTAIINTIPSPVIGGISILLFGMIASIGIKNMVDHKVDFSNPKVMIVSAAIMVLGLGNAKFVIRSIELDGLGLAAITGIVLNFILFYRQIIFNKKSSFEK
jgi:uracil permease